MNEPPIFTLTHDAFGILHFADADGRSHAAVEPVRSFPLSDPQRGVAICDADGRELVWIEDLNQVIVPLRQVILDELAKREFMPIIEKVIQVSDRGTPAEWEVKTDRGPTRFLVNDEADIRRLAAGGLSLRMCTAFATSSAIRGNLMFAVSGF